MNDKIDPPDSEPVGSLADEAGKLLAALGEWASDQGGDLGWGAAAAATQATEAAKQVGEHVGTGAAECTYCPICRTVHAVRTSPEVRAQLATAATALLQAGTGLLASLSARPAPGRDSATTEGSPMEHIDLDDDSDNSDDTDDTSTDWKA